MIKKRLPLILLAFCLSTFGNPIKIVAAENFYGQIAEEIGQGNVSVTSILNNPQQDPHLFSSTPANARQIANADIIIYNGIDYDPWIKNLASNSKTVMINVSTLVGKKEGDNPHIWYDPTTMKKLADTLTVQFQKMDPDHQSIYQQKLNAFNQNYEQLLNHMTQFCHEFENTAVIATEPVFNDMASQLGLRMFGQSFQISIMNGTEPSVSDTKEFERLLKQHQVQVLIYNNQVTNPITERMKNIAKNVGIPIVGVSETEPPHQDYFSWMTQEINDLTNALHRKKT
jgi:zinc/manganese transport system substrate-binding protein